MSSATRKVLAWCVHFYTALGLVAAGGMAVAIVQERFAVAFLLMLIATLIDATDGTLARLVKIKEALPHFDGRRLDDLIDFQTFTTLPLLLMLQARLLPEGQAFWLVLPLLASAYGFCQVSAKTEDGYFLGFPSYWNIIAFYMYVLRPPEPVIVAVVIFFSLMTFVPARYLYPTHQGFLNRLTNQLAVPWMGFLVWIVIRLSNEPAEVPDDFTRLLGLLSLWFPFYYLGVSWLISVRIWRRAWRQAGLRAAHLPSSAPERAARDEQAGNGH